MTPLDPDRILALSYVPAPSRAAVEALWRLDAALGAVVAGAREKMVSRIKLAWWRESLEKLDTGQAPAEPLLRLLAREVIPSGVGGADLAEMEQGWAVLLAEDALCEGELRTYAEDRGAKLFKLTARLLGGEINSDQAKAGEGWALTDLARHSGQHDADAALIAARERLTPAHWPSALRPIGMLAALARRDVERGADIEPQGSPGRMMRMLRHRLTGR